MASGTVQTAEDRCSGRTTGLLSRLCRLAADGLAAEVRTGTQLQNLVCLCKMRMPRTDVSHNQIERIRETQNPLLRSPDLLCRQPQKRPRKPRCRALVARGQSTAASVIITRSEGQCERSQRFPPVRNYLRARGRSQSIKHSGLRTDKIKYRYAPMLRKRPCNA